MRVSRSCLNQITSTFLTIALVQVYPNQDLTVQYYLSKSENFIEESWHDNYRNYNKIFHGVCFSLIGTILSVLDEPSSNGDDVENDIDESFLRNKSFGFSSGGV
ncbi:21416_t:CDS:2 [Rhizophagus irregularis]|nr:21416_t:CDS:2 [Rhizophagus irregularis]